MSLAGSSTPDRSARRGFRPCLQRLEPRDLPATAVTTLIVTPAYLNPPNNKFVSVSVSGYVIDSTAKLTPHAQFQVSDEYRRFEPGGQVTLTKVLPTVYTFKFSVVLQARRAQTDLSGRQYFIEVGAQDSENAGGLTAGILVPHDKLKAGTYPAASTVTIRTPHDAPKGFKVTAPAHTSLTHGGVFG